MNTATQKKIDEELISLYLIAEHRYEFFWTMAQPV